MSSISGGNYNSNLNKLGERTSGAARKSIVNESLSKVSTVGMMGIGAAVAGGMLGAASQNQKAGALVGALAGAAAGALLKLPGNTTYKIKEGDSLESIAKKSLGPKASPKAIESFINETLTLNNDIIQDKNKIYTGDLIALPQQQKAKAQESFSFVESSPKEDLSAQIEWAKSLENKVKNEGYQATASEVEKYKNIYNSIK